LFLNGGATVCRKGILEQLQHFKTIMFHKVVQRGLKEAAKNVIFILQIIHCCFQHKRTFKIG